MSVRSSYDSGLDITLSAGLAPGSSTSPTSILQGRGRISAAGLGRSGSLARSASFQKQGSNMLSRLPSRSPYASGEAACLYGAWGKKHDLSMHFLAGMNKTPADPKAALPGHNTVPLSQKLQATRDAFRAAQTGRSLDSGMVSIAASSAAALCCIV